MLTDPMTVSVVIVNWNGRELLEKFLPSVLSAVGRIDIILADDGSDDSSVEFVKSKFKQVKIVSSEIHRGFASTANMGVTASGTDVVVLLNTDVSPERGFLGPLLERFSDQIVFAVGCLDRSHEKGNTVLRGRGTASWLDGYYIHDKGNIAGVDTAWVSGGSGAFRRSIWMELGGMDELYNPFYWEDLDLSYRARKAGYLTLFEKQSIVDHYHQEGKIRLTFPQSEIRKTAFRNQLIFVWKNLSDPGIFMRHLIRLTFDITSGLMTGKTAYISGLISALRMLPEIISHRLTQSKQWRISDRMLNIV